MFDSEDEEEFEDEKAISLVYDTFLVVFIPFLVDNTPTYFMWP